LMISIDSYQCFLFFFLTLFKVFDVKMILLMRILLAEDEKALARALQKIFEKNNYSVDIAFDGEEALEYLRFDNYDIAILDIMMPKVDGISVVKEIRAKGNKVPVLFLTAKSEVEDKILGLDSGANDYISKPFDTRELLARIRSLTRGKNENENKISLGYIILNKETFELSSPFGSYKLANKEYQLMEYFLSYPKRIFSIDQLMDRVWGYDTESETNVVWVYVSFLRKKLKSLKSNVEIKASRNAGY